jgi:hypothetical protein
MPNTITSIGGDAFGGCSSLGTITIPNSVTEIDDYAFGDCGKLMTVISQNPTPPISDNTCFSDATYSEGVLYVPEESLSEYRKADGWKEFQTIRAIKNESGIDEAAAETARVSVDGGAICVSGAAEVRIVAMNGVTVYRGRGNCRVDVAPGIYVVIADNVTTKLAVK